MEVHYTGTVHFFAMEASRILSKALKDTGMTKLYYVVHVQYSEEVKNSFVNFCNFKFEQTMNIIYLQMNKEAKNGVGYAKEGKRNEGN